MKDAITCRLIDILKGERFNRQKKKHEKQPRAIIDSFPSSLSLSLDRSIDRSIDRKYLHCIGGISFTCFVLNEQISQPKKERNKETKKERKKGL